jgi:hypothetical protein
VNNSLDTEEIDIPVLLPHEILDALARAGPDQFAKSMLGNRTAEGVGEFWEHCLTLPEWRNHPTFADPSVSKKSWILSYQYRMLR